MLTIDETMRWSVEDVIVQIQAIFPQGWIFSQKEVDQTFTVSISTPDGRIVWRDAQPDLKLVLLNAYGWLFTRNVKPVHPAWAPRQKEVTFPIVQGDVDGNSVSDPEDLDPDQIRSVYEKRGGRR